MTREEALLQGSKTYTIGRPCKRGHKTLRWVSSRHCVECCRERANIWRVENLERAAENDRKKYLANQEHHQRRARIRRRHFPEAAKARSREHYKNNREKYILRSVARIDSLRKKSFKHEQDGIKAFYEKCPSGYEVDHIIPLTHPLVSGLHCISNLQYLTTLENRRKFNKWSPEW